ncbi:MAG: OsmC family protein [Reyranellaceae bacterium]
MADRIVNGVNVSKLFGTIEAIKQDGAIAAFRFRADNRWRDGARNVSRFEGFFGAKAEQLHAQAFEMGADEPPLLLGEGASANPVEFVLHGLAACLTTSMVYHAAARGIDIEEIESRLEGDLDLRGFLGMDKSIRNGYSGIRVSFRIKANAPDNVIAELAELAKSRSPVFDIVTNGVPVAVSAERMPAQNARRAA